MWFCIIWHASTYLPEAVYSEIQGSTLESFVSLVSVYVMAENVFALFDVACCPPSKIFTALHLFEYESLCFSEVSCAFFWQRSANSAATNSAAHYDSASGCDDMCECCGWPVTTGASDNRPECVASLLWNCDNY